METTKYGIGFSKPELCALRKYTCTESPHLYFIATETSLTITAFDGECTLEVSWSPKDRFALPTRFALDSSFLDGPIGMLTSKEDLIALDLVQLTRALEQGKQACALLIKGRQETLAFEPVTQTLGMGALSPYPTGENRSGDAYAEEGEPLLEFPSHSRYFAKLKAIEAAAGRDGYVIETPRSTSRGPVAVCRAESGAVWTVRLPGPFGDADDVPVADNCEATRVEVEQQTRGERRVRKPGKHVGI